MAWINKTDKDKFEFTKDGDTLTGKIITFKPMRLGGLVYDLIKEEGDLVYFFGSTQLDSILPELKGRMVKIVYLGTKKLEGGREIKEYTVDVWEDDPDKEKNGPPDDDTPF